MNICHASEDYHPVGMFTSLLLTENWRRYSLIFTASGAIKDSSKIEFQIGGAVGTVDIAGVSLRPGVGDSPVLDTEAKIVNLTAGSFDRVDVLQVPVSYRGKSVRNVAVTLSCDGEQVGKYWLQPSDYGSARFKAVPIGKPLVINVTSGIQKAEFVRTLVGGQRLDALLLPDAWSKMQIFARVSPKLASHPLLGAWESYASLETVIGQEFQHLAFTFQPDETGSLEMATVSKETEMPTGPPKMESFRWNVAPGTHRITIGTNVYTWEMATSDQIKQLTLKGVNGRNYTLFRN